MTWPTHESVALIERWLPPALIDPAVLEPLRAHAHRLPDAFASHYLECRLEGNDARVDWLASIAAGAHAGVKRDAHARQVAALAGLGKHGPAWARVGRFLRAWNQPAARLRERIPLLWLEFDDLRQGPAQVPDPCFHACVDSAYMGAGRQGQAGGQLAGKPQDPCLQSTWAAALDILLDGQVPVANARALATCFERLPAAGRIIHVSAMLARTPAAIKVYGCVPVPSLEGYLRDIGWAGRISVLNGLLDRFCTPATIDGMVYFDLAIDTCPTSYVGIVFSQLQLRSEHNRDPRREALLARLVEARLCAPHKRDALLQWPGSDRVHHAGSSRPTRIRRWLDIKVAWHPDGRARAKAYLGFMPVFSLF